MAKRGRKESTLTGGSGDVKPQILSTPFTTAAADTSFSLPVNVPVPRIGPTSNKATIMEVLKVWFMVRNPDLLGDKWVYLSTVSLVGNQC